MAKKNKSSTSGKIDCACVIHGTGYEWIYVERLFNMLTRHIPQGINFHVYTEHDRSVPPHMIKHCLETWPGITGPKKSWWYKMHLFNPEHHTGDLLYFDLDTVIVRDLSWVAQLPSDYFWGIRDFRYLQRATYQTINSSAMWFNVSEFSYVWDQFLKDGVSTIASKFQGDQDYITKVIDYNRRRYFDDKYFESYRWQCLDGGYDFQYRKHKAPGTGVRIAGDTAVVVFHGKPKPHEVTAQEIVTLWV